MMFKTIELLITSLGVGVLHAQMGGIDMAAIQKWNNAKVIRYHVAGVHQGRVSLADYVQADAADRMTLDFDWDARGRKPIGEIRRMRSRC